MRGKREDGKGRPRLVGPGEEDAKPPASGTFVSFMPMVSTAERRKEAGEAFGLYRARALPAIKEAELALRSRGKDKDGVGDFIAIETFISDKLGECCRAVCATIDPSLYELFSRVAGAAASPSRMVMLDDFARAGYEELAPELSNLCLRCGIEPPPADAATVIRARRPDGGG